LKTKLISLYPIFAFALLLSLHSCWSESEELHYLKMPLAKDAELKVRVTWIDSFHLEIINAGERIPIENISYEGDSMFFKMPVFGTEFKGLRTGHIVKGFWYNYLKKGKYRIPFTIEPELASQNTTNHDVTGRYRCEFKDADGNRTPAIAIFQQTGRDLVGTFQTETGDYRFLQGFVNGDVLQLSTFDGSHAFWFTAIVRDDSTLQGLFRSGTHWLESWQATRDEHTQLADMKALTYLKKGYSRLSFAKPDHEGKTISLDDSLYLNKPVIVQIMGTWCPNCMDETRFLVEMHNKYHSQGLEIVALDFEPDTSFNYFKKRAGQFTEALEVPYPILLAGLSKKEEAQKELPMLNKVISYPTAIFINRDGTIREIHTGFNGPGTGQMYKNYCHETEELIKEMIDPK